MKKSKILALIVAVVIIMSTMGLSAFANTTQIVLPDGITAEAFGTNVVTDGVNFYATIADAISAIHGSDAILYCNPNADNVGGFNTYGHVCNNLTIYGNGSSISSGKFEVDTPQAPDVTCSGPQKEITFKAFDLDGVVVWGTKSTIYDINIEFTNCNDGAVFIWKNDNSLTSKVNITMTDCVLSDNDIQGGCGVFSHAAGTVTLFNVDFTGISQAVALNNKSTTSLNVVMKDCDFTNCGASTADYTVPVSIKSSLEGGTASITADNCNFTGTVTNLIGQDADILIDYSKGETTATVLNTSAKVGVEVEDNTASYATVTPEEKLNFANDSTEAEKIVASIGEDYYTDLQEAIDAAGVGETVVVLSDISAEVLPTADTTNNPDNTFVRIDASDEVILDLNGKVISVKGSDDAQYDTLAIRNHGNLTIIDSSQEKTGKVTFAYNGTKESGFSQIHSTILNFGTLTVEGGTIENTATTGYSTYGIYNYSWGGNAILTVEGGTISSNNSYAVIQAIYDDHSKNNNYVTIIDGTFNGGLYTWYQGACNDCSLAILDGTFNAGDNTEALRIRTSGTFALPVTIGDDVEINGDLRIQAAAKVGNKYYAQLPDAVKASVTGDTITLLSDIDVGSYENGWSGDTYYSLRIGAGKEVTLDLNGKTLKSTGGSDKNQYAIIQNDGKLTITDSSDGKTGKIVNEATLLMAGKMSRTIYNQGSRGGTSLVINGGTIENTVANKIENGVTVENYYPYAIDSITAGDVALTISDDAKIIANNFYAIRARSQGGSGTQTVSISGGEIVGGLGVDLKIAELEGKSDTMNLTISGGKITGSDETEALRVINYAVNAVPAEADTINVTGGKFIGEVISIDGNSDVNTPAFGGFLNGGSYTVKPDEALLAEGFSVGAISNGVYEVIEPIVLKYIPTQKDGKIVEGSWNIVIDAGLDRNIFEFVGAELVLSSDASRVEGGFNEERMNYNIYGVDGKTSAGLNVGSALNNPDTHTQVYRINTIEKERLSGRDVVIGTIVFDGKGTPDIALLDGSTVVLTKEGTHDEAYYTTTEGTLEEVAFASIISATTKRNVKVNIEFEHDINANVLDAYKFMTVTLKDSIGNPAITKNVTIEDINNGYVEFPQTTIGVITVTLKAPGFRTYTYQTTMEDVTDDFELNFWNSVKRGKELFIEEGNNRSKMAHNFLVGDIAMDYIIDKYDLAAVTSYYGIYDIDASTDAKYVEKLVKYDLNRDGDIDILDVAYVLHGMGN